MSEYAHTADGITISLVDLPPPEANRAPVTLISGRPRVYIPKAPSGTPLGDDPIPEWDIYNLVRDLGEPLIGTRNYYQSPPVTSYAFTGLLGTSGGQVTEAINWAASRLPIAELYDIKVSQELEPKFVEVYDQGVTVNLVGGGGTRDLRTDQRSFANYVSIGSSKLPASTDYTIFDLWGAPFLMRKTDWDEIATGLSLHYTQTNANRDSHLQAMVALRDTPDWEGLANYDVSTGWPAAPVQS